MLRLQLEEWEVDFIQTALLTYEMPFRLTYLIEDEEKKKEFFDKFRIIKKKLGVLIDEDS